MIKIPNSAANAAPSRDFVKCFLLFCAMFSYFIFLANGLSFVFGDSYEWIEYGSKGSWEYFWHHPRWDRPAFLLMHLLLFPLFGWNTFGYYAVHGLFFAAAMVLLWLLARKIVKNEIFAWICIVFAATSFDTVVWPFLFLGDAAGMEQTFVLAGILLFLQYHKSKKTRWIVVSAAALFLAMAFKQPSRFVPIALILFLLFKKRIAVFKDRALYALLGVLFAATLLFMQSPYHNIGFRFENILNFGEVLMRFAGIFFVFAAASVLFVKKISDECMVVIAWLVVTLAQLPLFPHTEPRYLIGLMFPFSLLIVFLLEKGFVQLQKQKAFIVVFVLLVIGLYPNLSAVNNFVWQMKPYFAAKEDTRLFLESNLSNALVLYHWGAIDFFGKNNEYRNYNPAITGGANLSAFLHENRSTYLIHYPRKQQEIERIQNKTLYKKIQNGPVEFWVWKVK